MMRAGPIKKIWQSVLESTVTIIVFLGEPALFISLLRSDGAFSSSAIATAAFVSEPVPEASTEPVQVSDRCPTPEAEQMSAPANEEEEVEEVADQLERRLKEKMSMPEEFSPPCFASGDEAPINEDLSFEERERAGIWWKSGFPTMDVAHFQGLTNSDLEGEIVLALFKASLGVSKLLFRYKTCFDDNVRLRSEARGRNEESCQLRLECDQMKRTLEIKNKQAANFQSSVEQLSTHWVQMEMDHLLDENQALEEERVKALTDQLAYSTSYLGQAQEDLAKSREELSESKEELARTKIEVDRARLLGREEIRAEVEAQARADLEEVRGDALMDGYRIGMRKAGPTDIPDIPLAELFRLADEGLASGDEAP